MPLTFPAHVAAVLPFRRAAGRAGVATALVVGACTPDLAYVVGFSIERSHTLPALALVDVPLGMLVVLWLEWLVLPVLAADVPAMLLVDWPTLFRPAGLHSRMRALVPVAVGVAVGAGTHLLWDGLTHPTWWPARVLYPGVEVAMPNGPMPLATLLWSVSSVVGTLALLAFVVRCFPGPLAPRGGRPGALLRLLALVVVGAVLGLLWGRHGQTTAGGRSWHGKIDATLGTFWALTLAASLERRRRGPPLGV